jgi:hypothetical protein
MSLLVKNARVITAAEDCSGWFLRREASGSQ